MVDLSKFISNKKNIEWNCSLIPQPSLLSKLPLKKKKKKFIVKVCSKFNYVRTKKKLGWSQSFFKNKKIINF